MTQPPVPSPCINVCRMHPTAGVCEGCLRTLEEIAAWSRLDEAAKRAEWLQLSQRRVLWRRLHAAPTEGDAA